METCSDSDVSPGVWFFPGLHHGTCLEPHRTLVRFQTEVKDRFSGVHRSPQQAESPIVAGDQTLFSNVGPTVIPVGADWEVDDTLDLRLH